MLKLARLAVLAVAGALVAAPAFSQDKAAATVNGRAVPQARVDLRIKAATAQGQHDSPALRKMVLEDMINLEVLSQAAIKKGLDKRPETSQQIELVRQSTLAGAYVQDYLKAHPIGDDVLKREYENQKQKAGKTEYKVAHILVSSENEAKAVADQLKGGGDFEKIAKEKSNDPGSKERGGDLDWNVPSNFVPQFSDAMTHLKKGEVSGPVQSPFGWHIIKLEDTRDLAVPPFEQVKPGLMQHMQQEAVQKLITDLRKSAKVEAKLD